MKSVSRCRRVRTGCRWTQALAAWFRMSRGEPTFFESDKEAQREQMSGQIAAIRLADQTVMVNLETVRARRLEEFSLPILAHEIGHHVYVPGNLADNARMIAAMLPVLFGLPKDTAHLVANLYGDLLLNDRLQRRAGLDMAAVYRRLKEATPDAGTTRVWKVYTHAYEQLWRLPTGTLSPAGLTSAMTTDAVLIARLIRHYAADWLRGTRRFACSRYPYLQEDADEKKGQTFVLCACDMRGARDGDSIPDGLAGIISAEFGDDDDDFLRIYLAKATTGNDGARALDAVVAAARSRLAPTDRKFREPLETASLRAIGSILRMLRSRLATIANAPCRTWFPSQRASRRGLRNRSPKVTRRGIPPTIWRISTCSVRS